MDFNALLDYMVEKNASDLFITAGRAPSMKIDGKMQELGNNPLSAEQSLMIVESIMSQKQKDEFDHTKECQFAISR